MLPPLLADTVSPHHCTVARTTPALSLRPTFAPVAPPVVMQRTLAAAMNGSVSGMLMLDTATRSVSLVLVEVTSVVVLPVNTMPLTVPNAGFAATQFVLRNWPDVPAARRFQLEPSR